MRVLSQDKCLPPLDLSPLQRHGGWRNTQVGWAAIHIALVFFPAKFMVTMDQALTILELFPDGFFFLIVQMNMVLFKSL